MHEQSRPSSDHGQADFGGTDTGRRVGKKKDVERKNDEVWAAFFERTDTLAEIDREGFSYITADQLNALKMRDARLLTKLDTLEDRPSVFKQHNLTIFPVKNGEYILFRDPENKSYFRLSDKYLDLAPTVYSSAVDLTSFDAFPGLQRLNESQALDFALVSSLLRTFTEDPGLHLVIRGRNFSGKFGFDLPQTGHTVRVNGVQIEVDGGYESRDAIYLVEAKTGRRSDFHIRQLYYPYLEWSARTRKRVSPIFFFVTNGKFYFFEFQFGMAFGDLSIVRAQSYVINESPVAHISLSEMMRRISDVQESKAPFPQANDLDKLVDLLSFLHSRAQVSGESAADKSAIAEYFEFDDRQGDYYPNAGVYLDLMVRTKGGFTLTRLGSQLIEVTSLAHRTRMLVEQMLHRPVFRESFALLIARSLDPERIEMEEIAGIIQRHRNDVNYKTLKRRSSTVKRWLRWVKDNTEVSE